MLALAGAGYAAYLEFFKKSEAVVTYQKFAEAVLHGQADAARGLAQGDAALAQVEKAMSDTGAARRMSQLMGSRYAILDEASSAGRRTIHAEQVVAWDPPGTTSAMGAVRVHHDHKVVVEKTAQGWKVVSFEDTVTGARDWKGQPL